MSGSAQRGLVLAGGLAVLVLSAWLAPWRADRVREIDLAAVRSNGASAAEPLHAQNTRVDAHVAGATSRAEVLESASASRARRECSVFDFTTGAPIAGVELASDDDANGLHAARERDRVLTDERGRAAAASGTGVSVVLRHPRYLERRVALSSLADAERAFGLYPRAELRITLLDADGAPVEGARVELTGSASHLPAAERLRFEMSREPLFTSRDGRCRFDQLAAGERFDVRVDGQPFTGTLSPSDAATDFEIRLEPRARVHGRLVHAHDGSAAADVDVRLQRNGADDLRARSGGAGEFEFERVPIGVVALAIDWPSASKQPHVIEHAGDVDLGTYELAALERVSGSVHVPDAALAPSVLNVQAWRDDRLVASCAPREDGSFELELPEGRATLAVCLGGKGPPIASREVSVPSSGQRIDVPSDVRGVCFRVAADQWSDGASAIATRRGAGLSGPVLQRWSDIPLRDGRIVLPLAVDEPVELTFRVPAHGGAFVDSCVAAPIARALLDAPRVEVGWGRVHVAASAPITALASAPPRAAETDASDTDVDRALDARADSRDAVRSFSLRSAFGGEVDGRALHAADAFERVPPGRFLALLEGGRGDIVCAAPFLATVGGDTRIDTREFASCALRGRIVAPAGMPTPVEVQVSWLESRGYWRAPVDASGRFAFDALPAGRFAVGLSRNGMLYVDLAPGESADVECVCGDDVRATVVRGDTPIAGIQQAHLLVAEHPASGRQRVLEVAVLDAGRALSLPLVEGAGVLRVLHVEDGRSVVSFAAVDMRRARADPRIELGCESVRCAVADDGLPPPRLVLSRVAELRETLVARGWSLGARRERDEWVYADIPNGAELSLVDPSSQAQIARFHATPGARVSTASTHP